MQGHLAGMQVADVAAAALQIKKKMTREEFVRNNRGINGTKDNPQDLPPEFLTELYNHFSEKAIRFPQLPSTLSQKHSNSGDLTVMKCAPGPPILMDRVYLVFIRVCSFSGTQRPAASHAISGLQQQRRRKHHEVHSSPLHSLPCESQRCAAQVAACLLYPTATRKSA
jgi:hypothetical protein